MPITEDLFWDDGPEPHYERGGSPPDRRVQVPIVDESLRTSTAPNSLMSVNWASLVQSMRAGATLVDERTNTANGLYLHDYGIGSNYTPNYVYEPMTYNYTITQ